MNVRLEYATEFLAGVYWNDELLFNRYYVELSLITGTYDQIEQNLALERLKHMLHQVMNNSIFISANEKNAIKKFDSAGLKAVSLPEPPVDQIIGMMLYCKLNAIMDGRLLVTQVKLGSDLGDGIMYLHHENESLGRLAQTGWWHDQEPTYRDCKQSASKVVSLRSNDTWANLDLHWEEDDISEETTKTDNVVVAFKKDDKE